MVLYGDSWVFLQKYLETVLLLLLLLSYSIPSPLRATYSARSPKNFHTVLQEHSLWLLAQKLLLADW